MFLGRLLPFSAAAFPQSLKRWASTIDLSGPAQASMLLRPACLLSLLSEAFCLGASSASVARRPCPIATEVHRQFLGRDFHPLVECAFARRTGMKWLAPSTRSR